MTLLGPVLHGLGFPAHRWQILTHADLYGVDARTRHHLTRLEERQYHSVADIAGELTAALTAGAAAGISTEPGTTWPRVVR